jgi:hypothetical protein
MGWPARIIAGLVFTLVTAVLGSIAFAVLSVRCCGGQGGGTEPAGWVVIGLIVLACATLAAVLAGGLAEVARSALGRRQRKD